jgi:hypothetical protein
MAEEEGKGGKFKNKLKGGFSRIKRKVKGVFKKGKEKESEEEVEKKPTEKKPVFSCKKCGAPTHGYPCETCHWVPEMVKEKPTGKEVIKEGFRKFAKPQSLLTFIIVFVIGFLTFKPLVDLVGLGGLPYLHLILTIAVAFAFAGIGATLTFGQFGMALIFGLILTIMISLFISSLPVVGAYFSLLPYGGLPLVFLMGFGIDNFLAKGIKSPKWHFVMIIIVAILIYVVGSGVLPEVMSYIPGVEKEVCYLECKATSLDPSLSTTGIDELCKKKCYGIETEKIGCTDCLIFDAEPTILPAKAGSPERIYVTLSMSEDAGLAARDIVMDVTSEDYEEGECLLDILDGKCPAEIKNIGVLGPEDDRKLSPGESVNLLIEFGNIPCKSIFEYDVNVNYSYNTSGTLKIITKKEEYPTGGFIELPGMSEEEEQKVSTTSAGPINFNVGADALGGEYIAGIVDIAYITLGLENAGDGEAIIDKITIKQSPPGDEPAKKLNCSDVCSRDDVNCVEEKKNGVVIGYKEITGGITELKKDSSDMFLCEFTLPTAAEVEESLTYTFSATVDYKFIKTNEFNVAVDTETSKCLQE